MSWEEIKRTGGGVDLQQTTSRGAVVEIASGVRDQKSEISNPTSDLRPPISYKGELTRSMEHLAADPAVRFIGYGVRIGGRALGTLKNVPDSQLIEMPVAENLMVGFAIGLALKGLKPVVFIERFDFILNALDAIVNHLDKIKALSKGEFAPTMILRVVVGNRQKPLFTGATHTQDCSTALRALVDFPVLQLFDPAVIFMQYKAAHALLSKHSTMLVEYKDFM